MTILYGPEWYPCSECGSSHAVDDPCPVFAPATEEEMQAEGTIEVGDENGVTLGTAQWRPELGKWSFTCGAQRGWRKTGAKAVAAIEKATKSREEQQG
jgi:hypothetical protein